MIVRAAVYPKLETVKVLVRPLSKKRYFRTRFDSQLVKGFQSLLKSSSEHFYHIFSIALRKHDLINVSLSDMWNLSSGCQQIDRRWEVSSTELWEFATPNSDAII